MAVVAGNVYPKYTTGNPIARKLMRGFLDAFDALTTQVSPHRVFEVGCGEGYLSCRLAAEGAQVQGIDLSPEVVAQAQANAMEWGVEAQFAIGDIHKIGAGQAAADLLICCEVLEHVTEPEAALARLFRLAEGPLLLSVPREPIWRMMNLARGKYLNAWGNTPGHLNHWSKRGFLELVRQHGEILAVRSPLPWTMVLARPHRS